MERTNTPATTGIKADHSRTAIAEFLAAQQAWLARATNAAAAGYPIETIGICMYQVHAILRRGLWLHSQNQALVAKPELWNDAFLSDLLQRPLNDWMADAQDEEVYGAAEKFDLITSHLAAELRACKLEASRTMHGAIAKRMASTKDIDAIARRLLIADATCQDAVIDAFHTFDERITSLIASSSRPGMR